MAESIIDGYEMVPVLKLKAHPRNANLGDLGAVHQSIEANGFYSPLIVNRRTSHVLAGNHRLAAARMHRMPTVPVVWVDVDPETELRILLADNKTTRLGVDDAAALETLLRSLAATDTGLIGTGYDEDDLQKLIDDDNRDTLGLSSSTPEGMIHIEAYDRAAPGPKAPKEAGDNGVNTDGSVYAICPDCGKEFTV